MELLAPAGSWEAMVACVEAGADAVYGGLPWWNARQRADNFSIDSLGSAVDWCHGHGRRFYLTLNILLRDPEIRDLLEVVTDGAFPAVDALIVADVGLMDQLRCSKPETSIHASTQFGAQNCTDLHWLRARGVDRVILPREASLEEIERLAQTKILPVEVFVWGSRCFCYSGDCRLNGYLTGGSGDRGCCIGVCRHTYVRADVSGQWLYPEDIDVQKYVRQLIQTGIVSLKIEGRRRRIDQLADVVRRYRRLIDSPETFELSRVSNRSHGWLMGGHSAEHHVRAGRANLETIGDEPLTTDSLSGGGGVSGYALQTQRCPDSDRFIDLLLRPYDCGGWQLRATTHQGEVVCAVLNPGSDPVDPPAVLSISPVNGWPIREARVEGDGSIGWCMREAVDALTKILPPEREATWLPSRNRRQATPLLSVEVSTREQACAAQECGATVLIVPFNKGEQVSDWEEHFPAAEIIFKMPMFDWKSVGWEFWAEAMEGRRVLGTRWSQLDVLHGRASLIGGESSLGIWNQAAAEVARVRGVGFITAPLDWSLAEAMRFASETQLLTDVTIAGHPTLGWSRTQWKSERSGADGRHYIDLLNTDLRVPLRIACDSTDICEVLAGKPMPVAGLPTDCGKFIRFRYAASHDAPDTVATVVSQLRHSVVDLERWAHDIRNQAGPRVRILQSSR